MALVDEELPGKRRCRPLSKADGGALVTVALTRAGRLQNAHVTTKIEGRR